jgi:hypothetical protein
MPWEMAQQTEVHRLLFRPLTETCKEHAMHDALCLRKSLVRLVISTVTV